MAQHEDFDPNAPALTNSIFGLPFTVEEANVVIIPVPWEATVSYNTGTAKAPQIILQASQQVDLLDPHVPNAWKAGLAMLEINKDWQANAEKTRETIEPYFQSLDESKHKEQIEEVNKACRQLTELVKEESNKQIALGKIPAVLGGDHSTPLGLMQALAEKHESFGILQIDAHMDLRKAYEGFTHSHASIMYNALQLSQVSKLVQVGIRDYCEQEQQIAESDERIAVFYNHNLQAEVYSGISWADICKRIVEQLPKEVYISFDIDGLEPSFCPSTGTPVPGGLSFDQAIYLLVQLVHSGRNIIGFDLCEVGNNEWDANVGARMLYKLANLMALSNKLV